MKAVFSFILKFITGRYHKMTFEELISFFAFLGVCIVVLLMLYQQGMWPFIPVTAQPPPAELP